MTQIASTPPRTIRARIHDSAIRRVTRIYASTLSDVMTEALQNSRRADAAQVRIVNGGGNMYRGGGAKMYHGLGGSLSA